MNGLLVAFQLVVQAFLVACAFLVAASVFDIRRALLQIICLSICISVCLRHSNSFEDVSLCESLASCERILIGIAVCDTVSFGLCNTTWEQANVDLSSRNEGMLTSDLCEDYYGSFSVDCDDGFSKTILEGFDLSFSFDAALSLSSCV